MYEIRLFTGMECTEQVVAAGFPDEAAAISAAVTLGPATPIQAPYAIRRADWKPGDAFMQVYWDHDGVQHVGRHGPDRPLQP